MRTNDNDKKGRQVMRSETHMMKVTVEELHVDGMGLLSVDAQVTYTIDPATEDTYDTPGTPAMTEPTEVRAVVITGEDWEITRKGGNGEFELVDPIVEDYVLENWDEMYHEAACEHADRENEAMRDDAADAEMRRRREEG